MSVSEEKPSTKPSHAGYLSGKDLIVPLTVMCFIYFLMGFSYGLVNSEFFSFFFFSVLFFPLLLFHSFSLSVY